MSILASSIELSRQSGTIDVGLSWDLVPGSPPVDLDASAVCFSSTGTLVDAAFYNQLSAVNGSVCHSGDCKRGEKEGFDEVIKVSLDEVKGVNVIVFLISAFSGGTLENCESAFCEIKLNSEVLATLSATSAQTGSSTSLLLCMLFRHPETLNWHFAVIRQPMVGRHFSACLLPIRSYVDQVIDPGCLSERNMTADKTFEMAKGDQLNFPVGVKKLLVGLGWSTSGKNIDLDASCLMLCELNGLTYPADLTYFGDKIRPGVRSMGDNMTGEGDGDDEQIVIELDKVEKHVSALAILVNIYSSGFTFSDVQDAYVRLMDEHGKHVFAKFTLHAGLSKSCLIFCMLVRGDTPKQPWRLVSIGEESDGKTARAVESTLWEGSFTSSAHVIQAVYPPTPSIPLSTAPAAAQSSNDGCCSIC